MIDALRSLLFVPGNNPGMLQSAGVFGADAIILDLEDAVAPREKDAARFLVSAALQRVDFNASHRLVRINTLDTGGAEDLSLIVPCHPTAILVPKVQTRSDILQVIELLEKSETSEQTPVQILALIETPRGLAEAYSIATVHPRVIALAFGAEDYTASIGAKRTREGLEIMSARGALINAAAAAEVVAIDTPFTDINDEEGLRADVALARQLGFKGKLAIHPRQVDIIHELMNPSTEEVRWAQRVLAVLRQAEQEGSGAVALDGKMIDAPIELRARQILRLAERFMTGEGTR